MGKNDIKQKIQELVDKYDEVVKTGELKKYTEEETKKDFILPLFEILGWDVFNKKEVSAEEGIKSAGRVDYGFYIDSKPKFYLECKALKADLHDVKFAKQSISYSWNKGVTWAVLTDFESIKVFNTQNISETLAGKMLFEIPYKEFVDRLDQLQLLSKDSFEKGLINEYATKHGKMLQKVSITSVLSKDLNECRDILIEELSAANEGLEISDELLDEGVQKLLDRLIFIRVAEDRGIIDPPVLKAMIRQWQTGRKKGEELFESMVSKFRELDDEFNSNLFTEHPFEKWKDFGGGATEKVVKKLYGKEGYYEYDFKAVPADILGAVYENYLGYRLSQAKKGTRLGKDSKKRKEQGIYYTPTFIVDYIVENALKPVLDKCKSVNDLNKIKVLDPACGSGSFLLKALETIYEKHVEFGNTADESMVKATILTSNIYGVDLDEQAIEIARLNLLLSALTSQRKLPLLDKNIKNGNSLISGTDEELKKYFGENYRDKKPFNWEEEFPEVFAQGGFDVIIGNPPYVSYYSKQAQKIDKEVENFLRNKYEFLDDGKGKMRINSVMFFLERACFLLKKEGIFSYIIDLNIHENPFKSIRKFISENMRINEVVSGITAFDGIGSGQVILNASKSNNKNCDVKIKNNIDGKVRTIKYEDLIKDKNFSWEKEENEELINKIERNTIQLGDLVKINTGVAVYATKEGKETFIRDKKCEKCYPFLIGGKSIHFSYCVPLYNKYLLYDKSLEKDFNDKFDEEYFKKQGSHQRPFNLRKKEEYDRPKIIIRQSDVKLTATFTKELMYGNYSLFNLYDKENNAKILKFLLGLINSKLLTYYAIKKNIVLISPGKTPQIRSGQRGPIGLKQLPIVKTDSEQQKTIISLVDKMLELNKELQNEVENSNKWESIKKEIERTDKKIDEEVYRLCGLTEEEIKIVENE